MYNYSIDPFTRIQIKLNTLFTNIQELFYLLVLVATVGVLVYLIFVLYKKKRDLNDAGLDVSLSNKTSSGFVFGKRFNRLVYITSKEQREGHIICLGPSGTGKTSALLIPTLNNWNGTSFTIDISGDIFRNVKNPNKIVYEPENPNSIGYDVFYAVDVLPTVNDKNMALEKIAYALVPELPATENSSGAKFYNDGGRDIVTASLIGYYYQGLDFIDICNKIVSLDYAKLFSEIDKTGNEIAIKYINSFAGSLTEHISGCKGEAVKAVKLFATNSNVMSSIHRPRENEYCFNVSSAEDYNVFFKVSDAQLEVYSPIVRVTIALLLNYFSTRTMSCHNILFCLDELASFGKIDLIGSLRKLRKNKVRIFCLTQSLADLQMIYGGAETKAMMNNFAFKIVLGATDTDTQQYFAKLIGHKTVMRKSVQQSGSSRRITKSESKEFAIEPEELARLRKDLILIYPGGYMKLKKNYYFK